jgi:hypothetical protein
MEMCVIQSQRTDDALRAFQNDRFGRFLWARQNRHSPAFRRRGDITLCLALVGRTSIGEHPTKVPGSPHFSIFSGGGSPYESRIQKG